MKFTEASISAFTVAPGKASSMAFDTQVAGLGLKATARGSKLFLFQYWNGAKVQRLTIGRYGDITLTEARKIAASMRLRSPAVAVL